MVVANEKLKELLVPPGHIDEEAFDKALAEATSEGVALESYLVQHDFIKSDQIGQLVAEEIGIPFMNVENEKIEAVVLAQIPEPVASARGVVAAARTAEGVRVGFTDPTDLETIHFVEKRFGDKVIPHFITESDLKNALSRYRGSLTSTFQGLLRQLEESEDTDERDAVIVSIVDTVLQYGYHSEASDIHIEPRWKKSVIRFRVDGVMHDVLELPKSLTELISARLRILGRLSTDEHRAAQDGRIRYNTGESTVDVRVSMVPVTAGTSIVMRLLSEKGREMSLSDLGFLDTDLKKLRAAIKKPHGMMLVTGPTGSGKTTTVYAVLKILNSREVHISTIEDPVEYDIEGISQIQVNTKTNLSFAQGLRSIVRQDPDIIMVGEIRDEETADIAVNSAMTGHLVLSTLHANDAATTLPRLLDMGIEPFIVASTVNIVIAQRLVRKICSSCRESYVLSDDERKIVEREPVLKEALIGTKKKAANIRLFRGKGCAVCGDTGYAGRVGIFEVLQVDEDIRDLIAQRASSDKIIDVALKSGMTTMMQDGVKKALLGMTTLEEVLRAAKS